MAEGMRLSMAGLAGGTIGSSACGLARRIPGEDVLFADGWLLMESLIELVILIGLPAAGKSTFAQQRFAATHDVVSKDRLRRNGRPGRRQARLIDAALQVGRSIVVDNTNATIEDRSALICLGQAHGAHIAGYYFPTSVSDALERNRARTGTAQVPAVAIYATRKKLVPPGIAEGFAALYTVRIGARGAFEVRP